MAGGGDGDGVVEMGAWRWEWEWGPVWYDLVQRRDAELMAGRWMEWWMERWMDLEGAAVSLSVQPGRYLIEGDKTWMSAASLSDNMGG